MSVSPENPGSNPPQEDREAGEKLVEQQVTGQVEGSEKLSGGELVESVRRNRSEAATVFSVRAQKFTEQLKKRMESAQGGTGEDGLEELLKRNLKHFDISYNRFELEKLDENLYGESPKRSLLQGVFNKIGMGKSREAQALADLDKAIKRQEDNIKMAKHQKAKEDELRRKNDIASDKGYFEGIPTIDDGYMSNAEFVEIFTRDLELMQALKQAVEAKMGGNSGK